MTGEIKEINFTEHLILLNPVRRVNFYNPPLTKSQEFISEHIFIILSFLMVLSLMLSILSFSLIFYK